MARPYEVIWKYQADEEILQTSVWYFDPGSSTAVNPEDLSDLATITVADIVAELEDATPQDFYSHSVTVVTPVVATFGPARFINAATRNLTAIGTAKAMDSIIANVTLRGENAAEEPVSGGMRLSILTTADYDNNQLETGRQLFLTDALNAIFPPVRTINGVPLERAIRSVRGTPPVVEFVFPTVLEVSPRIGSRIDRVGNRPQRNTGPETP